VADESVQSFFAPAARLPREVVLEQMREVAGAPLMSALLDGLQGLLAVLNEERQILAVNDEMARRLGIADLQAVIGMRPGEALDCVHATEMPGGCGTSRACSSCGAAVSLVAALAGEQPATRKCVITTDSRRQLAFTVRASAFEAAGRRLLLLWLQDITGAEQWSMVEQAFFHDVRNVAGALHNVAELLQSPTLDPAAREELTATLGTLTTRLTREIEIQQRLSAVEGKKLRPLAQPVDLVDVVREVTEFARGHRIAARVGFEVQGVVPPLTLRSDLAALVRVLSNMVVNALEASHPGDVVKLAVRAHDGELELSVWNRTPLPSGVAPRLFVLHFSTKPGNFRGLGTYAIKTLGEEVLGGKVGFDSSEVDGTTFWLKLPLR
jgi:signal transduction histidine kinase